MQSGESFGNTQKYTVIVVAAIIYALDCAGYAEPNSFRRVYFREFAGNYLSGNYSLTYIHPWRSYYLAWLLGWRVLVRLTSPVVKSRHLRCGVLPALAGTGIALL